MSGKAGKKETSLYAPIRDHFIEQGYRALGEVNGCDVVAWDESLLIIIELKLTLNLTLVAQAVQRQKMADRVYVAVPRPKNKWRWISANSGSLDVLRRLKIGLLLVSLTKAKPKVDEVLSPERKPGPLNQRNRKALLREFEARTGDRNKGGCTRTKLVTAYREAALAIVALLTEHGPLTAAKLRKLGAPDNAHSILYKNYYGWFSNVSRGVYELTIAGQQSLDEFGSVD